MATSQAFAGEGGFVKILLVKLSSLGDVVHTLPVVQDIRAVLPNAQIDWVVERSFAPLLDCCPGLYQTIACNLRRWRKTPLSTDTRQEFAVFLKALRRTRYDAVIDLQGLTKSAVVARLARLAVRGKRYALANRTDGSGYEAPTRWLADVAVPIPVHTAAVERGRMLAGQALGYQPSAVADFGLKMPFPHDGYGFVATKNIAKRIAFVHGTSRADKEWPLACWIALGQRFVAAGWQVVLAHGNADELATSHKIAAALNAPGSQSGALIWPALALDTLVGALAQCGGVIGVDSGVSHIAVALDLPHVQLYNFDTAWRTGPHSATGRQVSVFSQPFPTDLKVWQAWLGCIKTEKGENAETAGNGERADSP